MLKCKAVHRENDCIEFPALGALGVRIVVRILIPTAFCLSL